MNRSVKRIVQDFRRHPWIHLVSVITLAISLFILGGFFLVSRNVQHIAEAPGAEVSGTLYLKAGLTDTDVNTLKDRLQAKPVVHTVTFKSKASVAEELKDFLSRYRNEPVVGTELFPDVMEIQFKQGTSNEAIGALRVDIQSFPEIEEVDFSEDWLVQYGKFRQFAGILGVVLMICVVLGTSFVIANFMGMRHQSRREEVDIIRLIGAEEKFVLTPFLMEGVAEGILGATGAVMGLLFARSLMGGMLSVQWSSLLGIKSWLFLSLPQTMLVYLIGVLMAVSGAMVIFLRTQERNAR